jgi:hypothetical protein
MSTYTYSQVGLIEYRYSEDGCHEYMCSEDGLSEHTQREDEVIDTRILRMDLVDEDGPVSKTVLRGYLVNTSKEKMVVVRT